MEASTSGNVAALLETMWGHHKSDVATVMMVKMFKLVSAVTL